jgi:hypothetical protein
VRTSRWLGELGVAALLVDHTGRQQGILGRDGAERAVGVPQHVADVEEPLPAVAGERLAVLAEVGDVVHANHEALVLGLGDVAAARVLDVAEVAGESHLLLVGDGLAGEHQHGVLVHARLDGGHLLARERLGDVDAGHLADEDRVEGTDGDGHGWFPPGLLWVSSQYPCPAPSRQPFRKKAVGSRW